MSENQKCLVSLRLDVDQLEILYAKWTHREKRTKYAQIRNKRAKRNTKNTTK